MDKEKRNKVLIPKFKDYGNWKEYYAASAHYYKEIGDEEKYKEFSEKLKKSMVRGKIKKSSQSGRIFEEKDLTNVDEKEYEAVGQVKEVTNFELNRGVLLRSDNLSDDFRFFNAACVIASKDFKLNGQIFQTPDGKPIYTVIVHNIFRPELSEKINATKIGSYLQVEGKMISAKTRDGFQTVKIHPNKIEEIKREGDILAPNLDLLKNIKKEVQRKQESDEIELSR